MTKEKFLKDMRRHANYFDLDVTISDNLTHDMYGGRGGDISFQEKGSPVQLLRFSFSFDPSGAKFYASEALFGDLDHEHYVPYGSDPLQSDSVGTFSRDVERFLSRSSQLGRDINEAKASIIDELHRRGELCGKDIESVPERRLVNPALEELKRDRLLRRRTGEDKQVYWSIVA